MEEFLSVVDNKKIKALIHAWLDMGEMMLACGAEVNRVEDTLSRVAHAYGAIKADVFVITSSIVLTATFPEERIYTMSRRITGGGGSDFIKLEEVNALSRRICSEPMSTEKLLEELKKINDRKDYTAVKGILGSGFAAGAFAVFFGGSLLDGIMAVLMGMLVWVASYFLAKVVPNKVTFNLICSFGVAMIICIIGLIMGGMQVDKVAIGVIMLLIPGIAITNAVRDTILGDTISGTLKLIQSLLMAFMIAAGFMLAIKISGVDATHISASDGAYQLLPGVMGSIGFALIFNLKVKYLPYIAAASFFAWGIYLICELNFGLGVFWCSLISGIFSDVSSQLLARIKKAPATLFLISTVIPLIPGSCLYYSAYYLVTDSRGDFAHYAMTTVLAVLGLALGIGFSAGVFSMFKKR